MALVSQRAGLPRRPRAWVSLASCRTAGGQGKRAREICREDPGLVYVTVEAVGWDGQQRVSGLPGYSVHDYFRGAVYLGPDDDGVEPTWRDADAV